MSKRVLIGVLGVAGISFRLVLFLGSDWLITGVYFLLARHSLLGLFLLLFLFLLLILLPALAILWVVKSAIVQPERWTKRRLTGLLLLILAFLLLTSLHPLSILVVGYLGMPRRIVPVSPYVHLECIAMLLALPLMAGTGAWLMRERLR